MFVLLQCLTVLAKTENKKVVNYKTDPTFMTKFTSGIYKNPFGCIGELISNGKDAIVKTDRKGYIDIIVKSNSILVRDNGIGMTRQEGEENISTIGRSSTAEWDDGKDLIGRFGTGLYSLFLLADKATIRSRKENEQGFEVVMHNTNYMEIEDIEIENVGTEVEMFFKEGVTLSVKQVEDFVQQNIMGNDYLYEIRRIKDETEIANEKVALEEAYIANAKKEMIEKRIKEEKDAMKEEEKTEEEKELTDEEKIEKKKKEKEEEKKQEEEIKKEVEASFQLTEDDKQTIENQKNEVSEYKYLQTAHWTDENDMEVFKTIFKERYGRTDLNLAKKVNFTIRQSNVQNQNFDSRFEAIIFVPTHNEAAMMGNTEMKPGKVEIFVSGSKVPIDLELNDLLKPFYFIIKSNHAEITTTREAFRDSDKTNKAIVNALTRKLVEIFSGQSDKVVHEYSKVIKRGYLDAKKENNDIHEKLVGILTFETKDGVMSLNKFLKHVEKINETIEAEAKEENTESEDNKEEKTEDEETEEKKKDEKKTDYKLKVDHLYYTNISKALVNNIENPLFDGILVPYIFLNDIHDEEIMNGLKKHKSLTMKNIISHRFEFREVDAEEHKNTIAFIKDTLKDYVSDVVVSKRLQKYPFSIITNENAMPSAFKAFFGDNKFDDNFMREYFDPKPVLEVNVDSNEYQKIDDTRDANAILTLYLATCVACKVDPYNKVAAFTDLMNAGRAALGIDDKLEPTKKSPQGFEEMIKSMGGDGSMYQDFSDHPDHALDKEYDEDYKKKFNFDDFKNLQTEEEDDEKSNDEELKQELVTEASAEPEVIADSITEEAKDLVEEEKVVIEENTNDVKEMIEEDKENDDVSEMAGEDKEGSDDDIEEGFDMDSGDFDFDNFDWSQFEKWSQQQDMSGYDFDFKQEDMKADDNAAGEVREEAIKEEL